jgi:signal transduction histidine kinase
MELQALNILIVDDDDDDAFLTEDLILEGLTNPTPNLDRARSHEEALERLKETTYDLCMLDYRLGEGNGIGLLQALRSQNITTPIILLTGQGDQEIAVEAMKSGANDYIVKGKLSCESLSKSIRHAIQLHREAERREHTEAMLKKSHQELTVAHGELQTSLNKLKTAQNQILRSEKLAGIGRLAAGVCHEILNPLNIISGHTQALQMERKDDQDLLEDLGSVTEEIHRIEKIISGLLKFSRKGDVELKYTDINQELESVLAIIEGEMSSGGVEVVREFNSDLPKLLLDNDRMRQVYLNIINNAKYAMSGGGTLTVRTQVMKGNASSIPEKNGFLRISFMDTGPGIDKENLGKIFDPFFTTKPEDKGTGLGLSVCYSIVEKHGGFLEAESDGQNGTTFLIDLPLNQNRDSETKSTEETPETNASSSPDSMRVESPLS